MARDDVKREMRDAGQGVGIWRRNADDSNRLCDAGAIGRRALVAETHAT